MRYVLLALMILSTLSACAGRPVGEPTTRRIFVQYLDGEYALDSVASLLSEHGEIRQVSWQEDGAAATEVIDAGCNAALVVRDYPANLAEIEAALAELDVRPEQILVEVTHLRVELGDGPAWEKFPGDAVEWDGTGLERLLGEQHDQWFEPMVVDIQPEACVRGFKETWYTTVESQPKLLMLNRRDGIVGLGDYVPANTQEGERAGWFRGPWLQMRPHYMAGAPLRLEFECGVIRTRDDEMEVFATQFPPQGTVDVLVGEGQTLVIPMGIVNPNAPDVRVVFLVRARHFKAGTLGDGSASVDPDVETDH